MRDDPSAILPKRRPLRSLNRSGSPNVIVSGAMGSGPTFENASPTMSAGSARAKPVRGPFAPTSKIWRLRRTGDLMRMNAPNVPRNGGPGMKKGRVARTP